MCSIIGYSGSEIAAPIIVKGLKRMEYRGYDSVGVATESENQIAVSYTHLTLPTKRIV